MGRVHIQIAAELIEHHQIGRIKGRLLECKQRTRPRIAFGGDQCLFFRDQPKRRMARAMVQALRVVPWSAFHWVAWSASEASGAASN